MHKKMKYSKYKIFHYKEKLDSLERDNSEIKAPIHIRIKPTNVCNHSCWYCSYQSLDEIQLAKDMVTKDSIPKEKMHQIIDDCIDMGVKAITFSGGGEPFIYPHLLEIVQKLSASNIRFSSLTNGSKLKGEIAKEFAHNAEWIRISMDGWDDKSYAECRDVKEGEFSKVLENIKNFKKLGGKCSLGVSFIIDNKNYEHIYEFTKVIKAAGVDNVKFSPSVVHNEGKISNAYHEPIYKQTKENIAKAIEDFVDDTFEIYDTYHELEERFEKGYEWCPFLQILPIIGADLNVYSCQDKAYNLDTGLLGSIKERSFKEFWFDDKEKFFALNPAEVCDHHCISNEKNKLILDYLNIDKEHLPFV